MISFIPPCSVLENGAPGAYVARVEARDPDVDAQLLYAIDAEQSQARNEEGAIVKVCGRKGRAAC